MTSWKPKIAKLPDKFTKGILAKIDGRTELKKRLSLTYNRVIEDCGGIEALPHVKLCLIERFSWLEEFLRQIESKLAEGVADQGDLLGRWTQGVNAMTGLAKTLGITTPRPTDFIEATLYAPEHPPLPPNNPVNPPQASLKRRKGEPKGKKPQRTREPVKLSPT